MKKIDRTEDRLVDAFGLVIDPLESFVRSNENDSDTFTVLRALMDHTRAELRTLCSGIDAAMGGQIVVELERPRSGSAGEVKAVRVIPPNSASLA
jgi:hypothetical protein